MLQTGALPLGYVTKKLERITGLEIRKATFEPFAVPLKIGADYGARTRHLDLGKVALYQMS